MGAIRVGKGSRAALAGVLLIGAGISGCGGGGGAAPGGPDTGDGGPNPVAASWTWDAIAAAEPGSVRVMPLGDSITAGFGAPGGYRLPLQFAIDLVGVESIDFVGGNTINSELVPDPEHEGYGGFTLADLLAYDGGGAKPDSNLEQRLALYQPDVILLHAGTNDMFEGATWQESLSRMRALLEGIHAADPEIATLVAKLIPTGEASTNLLVDWFNRHLHQMVVELADAGQPLTLVDMQAACPDFVSGDGTNVHPDFDCYVSMSNAWAGGLVDLGAPVPSAAAPIPIVDGVTATASDFFGLYSPDLATTGVGLAPAPFDDLHLAEDAIEGAWRSDDFDVESDPTSTAVPTGLTAPYLELTLPELVDLRGLEIWNGRTRPVGDGWRNEDSILRVRALTSSDGVDWIDRGQLQLVPGPDRMHAAPQVVYVDWDDTRFVRLEVVALHIPPPPVGEVAVARVALSEVRLRGQPSQP